jgi:hypothetical protein
MTEVKELKINVPIPVSKTRKGRKKATVLPYAESVNTPSPLKKKPSITVPIQPLLLPVVKPVIKPVQTPVKVIEKPLRKTMNPVKLNIQPNKRKNFTLKRKFTAKRITIQVENSNKIKKNREHIENTVQNMALPEITERLRAKGLVRPTSNPPETMQRNMMIDIMMFPKPL